MQLLLFLFTIARLADPADSYYPLQLQSVDYPRLAIYAQITGDVELAITIDAEGTVTGVKRLKGHGLLADAAAKNVSTWRFGRTCGNAANTPGVLLMRYVFRLEGVAEEGHPRSKTFYTQPFTVTVVSEGLHWQP